MSDAEEAVLAALLNDMDGTLTDQAAQLGLKPEHFYEWRHKTIYDICLRLRADGRVPDVVCVCSLLNGEGELEKVGGVGAVTAMAGRHASLAAFSQHTELVITRYSQRQALLAMRETLATLEAEHVSREAMAEAVGKPLARITNALAQQAKVRQLKDAVHDAVENAHRRIDGTEDKARLISFGILKVDNHFTQIERHELVVIAARPSIGKSSLARQIAWEAVKASKRVAAFLLETSDTSFVEACAAQEAKVSVRGIAWETMEKQREYAKWLVYIKGLNNLKLYDHDMTMDAIEARCRVLAHAYRPDLVVIDYLQIVRGRKDNVSTADAIGDITGRCVSLVKFLGCPVLLMSQLNRDSERQNRQPNLADLRDSGAIESDATRIVFIHRPDRAQQEDEPNKPQYRCELLQGKLRDGPKGCVSLTFQSRWATFEDNTDDYHPTTLSGLQ